ncbi:MAG TPA: ImmA/IrrE family metallo-endopeptidase [Herpetosiphonaceae bacterium]|nr:ImmA/IrrE family metallo-endopeptidase [Herpetosiphonaceae bacterium]
MISEVLAAEAPHQVARAVVSAGIEVSGAASWNGRDWIIAISDDEPLARQRFSLMHEFKHVLDHTTQQFLYHDRPYQTAAEQAERVANHFAACLLMPSVVKRLWCQGNQDISRLAAMLSVSPRAVRYRLDQLRLTEEPRRCRSSRPSAGTPSYA